MPLNKILVLGTFDMSKPQAEAEKAALVNAIYGTIQTVATDSPVSVAANAANKAAQYQFSGRSPARALINIASTATPGQRLLILGTLTDPGFPAKVSAELERITGMPSALVSLDVGIETALKQDPPGIVPALPPPNTVGCYLQLAPSPYPGDTVYGLYLGGDLNPGGTCALSAKLTNAFDASGRLNVSYLLFGPDWNYSPPTPLTAIGDWRSTIAVPIQPSIGLPVEQHKIIMERLDTSTPKNSAKILKDGVPIGTENYYAGLGTSEALLYQWAMFGYTPKSDFQPTGSKSFFAYDAFGLQEYGSGAASSYYTDYGIANGPLYTTDPITVDVVGTNRSTSIVPSGTRVATLRLTSAQFDPALIL